MKARPIGPRSRTVRPLAADADWEKRIARALALAAARPTSAEPLRFYAALAAIQSALPREFPDALVRSPSLTFAPRLDIDVALRALPAFLNRLADHAPAALALDLIATRNEAPVWRDRLTTYLSSGGRTAADWPAVHAFVAETLLQPFAERMAAGFEPQSSDLGLEDSPAASQCPCCSGLPIVALLREEAHGARRSLVCGLCQTEWPALRVVCVTCGESKFEALPVFRAEGFEAVRLDACETCRRYIKTIDLTRDGNAVAIPDDLASAPLDLWARDARYRRVRPDLLRIADYR
jgi:FdhE protein